MTAQLSRMLCSTEVTRLEAILRSLVHEVETTEKTNLNVRVQEARELLARIDERRNMLPGTVPPTFVLVRTPRIYGYGASFDTYMESFRNNWQIPPAKQKRLQKWFYTDYSAHPYRQIRPFCEGAAMSTSTPVFALIVQTEKPQVNMSRFDLFNYKRTFAHSLCFDWGIPVNWHVDLGAAEIANGPHSGCPVYERFYRRAGVHCVTYRPQVVTHSGYYNRIRNRKDGPRTLCVKWLLHLVPPWGMLSSEEDKKDNAE